MGKTVEQGPKVVALRWLLPLVATVGIIGASGMLTGGLVSAYSSGTTVSQIADFEKLMKEIEFDMNEMQATIVFEEADSALVYAARLLESFTQVENFFIARSNIDAVEWSREYGGMAAAIASSIQGGQFAEAYDISLRFSADCEVCHDIYRPL